MMLHKEKLKELFREAEKYKHSLTPEQLEEMEKDLYS